MITLIRSVLLFGLLPWCGLGTGAAMAQVVDVSSSITFTNPRPELVGFFGNAITPVGADKVLVTALFDGIVPHIPQRDGVAYLFRTNGTLLRTIRNPQRDGSFFGHRVAALDASQFLIAASPIFSDSNIQAAVYLYNVQGRLLRTFRSPVRGVVDGFGSDVAVVGTDKILIGARFDSRAATNSGAAYLFSKTGQLLATITNPTPDAEDGFGTSLAGVGYDKIVIGALYDDAAGRSAGAAYLFDLQGKLLHTFTNPVSGANALFGYPVRAVGTDKVAIGSTFDSSGASAAGAVYVFSTNGTLLQAITSPVPETSARFGYSLAGVGSDKILIGGFEANRRAYLYRTDGTLLTTFTNSNPGFHWFGVSVAPVGISQLMIGDFEAGAAGEAYLFPIDGASDSARIDELVPCNGPYTGGVWKNRAHYVMTLSRVARNFEKLGVMTRMERVAIVKAGAGSSCGKGK